MGGKRTVALLVGVTLALAMPGRTASAPRIHYPPDHLVVSDEGFLHVIGELAVDAEGAEMRIRLNDEPASATAPRRREGGGAIFHGGVQLVPGRNRLEISFGAPGRPASVVEKEVFFLSPLGRDQEPPPDFGRTPFHRPGGDAACAGCHQTASRPEDAGPPTPEQSTCFSCHSRLTRAKEVHGPAVLWACTRCHNPASAPARYVAPNPVMPLCFSCHAEQKERFYGNRYQHGPTATGQCTICHSPHGTDNQFFLRKSAWRLCTTCHFEKASGRHVISWGPNGQGHPTHGKPDPNRVGRELSCASCHNPHAAPTPRLWNFGATTWLGLCRNCHRAILGG